jgi:hypothetical protein
MWLLGNFKLQRLKIFNKGIIVRRRYIHHPIATLLEGKKTFALILKTAHKTAPKDNYRTDISVAPEVAIRTENGAPASTRLYTLRPI